VFNTEIYVNCLLAIVTWNAAIGAIIGIAKVGQILYKRKKK
jgi:hypothetical protein